MTPDEKADYLAEIARELITRVRDDDPVATHRWIQAKVPAEDWVAFAVVLACAIPDDKPWSKLTEWAWIRSLGNGGPDTPERIDQRRRDLDEALHRRAA